MDLKIWKNFAYLKMTDLLQEFRANPANGTPFKILLQHRVLKEIVDGKKASEIKPNLFLLQFR